ncbi:MAG: PepSY domain-containing protein [Candidatus Neomarinimicrobiota bacterium]
MSRASQKKLIRTWHRRLGPIVGIQLFLWSLGGLYFSWVQLSAVKGEKELARELPPDLKFENFLAELPPIMRLSQLPVMREVRLGKLLNIPVYRLIMDEGHAETYNAITGDLLSPISRATAVAIAEDDFRPDAPVRMVTRIEAPGGEYRGPVPAWRVTFAHWKAPSIYVGVYTGEVTARRNLLWRAYDFLWMLHILDFGERADFNNWLLRLMSLLGLATIGSGYYLWYLTSTPAPAGKRRTRRR